MMSFALKFALVSAVAATEVAVDDPAISLLQVRATFQGAAEEYQALDDEEEQNPANLCRTGARRMNICYDARCSSTGQQPGGRNCAALPSGANGCCRSRITRTCTGPNMERCRLPGAGSMGGMMMGNMMGGMNMGNMMGMMGNGMMMGGGGMMGMMGGDIDDEAEAVGDPHLTTASGEHKDLCCDGGHCSVCPPALIEEESSVDEDEDQAFHEEEEQNPDNMCQSGIRVFNICYDRRCGSTGQRPGGRNCAALPSGANGCCRSRITRTCTGPNMDRCRCAGAGMMGGMMMGNMMGGMNMGNMMGMMGNGMMMGGMMGMGGMDEAEAVGDPHITTNTGKHFDLA